MNGNLTITVETQKDWFLSNITPANGHHDLFIQTIDAGHNITKFPLHRFVIGALSPFTKSVLCDAHPCECALITVEEDVSIIELLLELIYTGLVKRCNLTEYYNLAKLLGLLQINWLDKIEYAEIDEKNVQVCFNEQSTGSAHETCPTVEVKNPELGIENVNERCEELNVDHKRPDELVAGSNTLLCSSNTHALAKSKATCTLWSKQKRSFACQFCAYTSHNKNTVIVHTRTHTGEKPYACMHCSNSFSQVSSLNLHVLRKHDGQQERRTSKLFAWNSNEPAKRTLGPFMSDTIERRQDTQFAADGHRQLHGSAARNTQAVRKVKAGRFSDKSRVFACTHCSYCSAYYSSFQYHMARIHGIRHTDRETAAFRFIRRGLKATDAPALAEVPAAIAENDIQPELTKSDTLTQFPGNDGMHASESQVAESSDNAAMVETVHHQHERSADKLSLNSMEKPDALDTESAAAGPAINAREFLKHAKGEKLTFACQFCSYTSNRNDRLGIHILMHTGGRPFKCAYCSYRSVSKQTFNRHMLRKHNNIRVQNTSPGSADSKLSIHRQESKADGPLLADESDSGVMMVKTVDFEHGTVLETNGINLSAVACTKSGSDTGLVIFDTGRQQPQPLHEFPYRCDLCPFTAMTEQRLLNHMRSHTTRKPFKCNLCQKPYFSPGKRAHMRTYHRSFSFCELCPFSCFSEILLAKHKSNHSAKKNYQCPLCSYSRESSALLQRHIRLHEPDVCEQPSI